MRSIIWFSLVLVFVVYVVLVLVFGFEGPVALGIHFFRFTVTTAVLITYGPRITYVFKEVPAPGRDFLVFGIIYTYLSNEAFSLWNEAGRIFKVNTSVFSSPISGSFSLLVIVGGISLLIAPFIGDKKLILKSLAIASVASIALVFVAPLFR